MGISTKQSRTLGEVGEAIEEIREELRYNGAQTKDYFLAGHGKSGNMSSHDLDCTILPRTCF